MATYLRFKSRNEFDNFLKDGNAQIITAEPIYISNDEDDSIIIINEKGEFVIINESGDTLVIGNEKTNPSIEEGVVGVNDVEQFIINSCSSENSVLSDREKEEFRSILRKEENMLKKLAHIMEYADVAFL